VKFALVTRRADDDGYVGEEKRLARSWMKTEMKEIVQV
jgi:hypothetical protein